MIPKTKSLFGNFNQTIDELCHLVISIVSLLLLSLVFPLTLQEIVILIGLSLLIDIDHFLNPIIGYFYKVKTSVFASTNQNGVTIKIMHGVDVSLAISILYYYLTNDLNNAIGLFTVLSLHELWDFIVYDHRATELLLITRAFKRFKPGRRKYLVGLIFDQDSLLR